MLFSCMYIYAGYITVAFDIPILPIAHSATPAEPRRQG